MQQSNGRIDLLQAPNHISLFKRVPVKPTTYTDALTGQFETTALSNAYFSIANQQILQNGIRAGVYARSNNKYVVAQQTDSNLKIIMRAIFLEHAQHSNTDQRKQIETLNKLVQEYCIPRIFGEAQGYIKYLHDASTLAVPLSAPIYTTTDKTLEMKPFF